MPREVLLILLQNREQLFQLFVVDGVDVDARGLVEVAGQAGGVVGEEGAGASDFGVDLREEFSVSGWVGLVEGRGRGAYAEEFAVG
jgi:hypothetical protein